MGMTMTQKILAAHAGLESVVPGQLIEAKLDVVMANDITGPMAVPVFNQMADKVFDKDKVVLSYIDEFQVMAADKATGVANSTEGLADNVVEGKVLASKRQNSETYSATMAEKAGSTVKFADNLNAIQSFVDGKTITELEETTSKTNEEVTDAVTGATLADTAGYINAVIAAAKLAQ